MSSSESCKPNKSFATAEEENSSVTLVASIAEDRPGMKDVDVLKRAIKSKSIILTFDRDYGELIFKYPKLIPQGLVYFRFDPSTPEEPALILLKLLKQKEIDLLKHFTVIEDDRIRQRIL